MEWKQKSRQFLTWTSLAIVGGVLAIATDSKRMFEITSNMEIFSDVYREVYDDYVDEVDVNKMMRTGIDSMLATCDPYTNYFSEAQMEQLRINLVGGWDGIGVEVMKHGKAIVVKEVIEGSPAHDLDIRIGDELIEAGGVVFAGRKVEDVEQILHGKDGTTISIKVKRPTTGDVRDLDILRTKVVRKNVPYYGMLNDEETGYIYLTTFTERAAENVANALTTLQEDNNLKQVVLDLRENGGGLLIEAVNLCNIFLPKGYEIVSTRNKIEEWDRSFKTLNSPIDSKIPLIILINGHSASASEIVAGAIQDFDRGVLLGQNSFGKGLVQNTYDVGYNSKVKLTTAKYYIPSGRCIQALEYENGKPVEIPDSLRQTFETKGGRVVRDGNGLYPDEIIEKPQESSVVKDLLDEHIFFDYANMYREEHDSIASPKDFKLEDEDFEDFIQYLETIGYDYGTDCEKGIATLLEKSNGKEIEAAIQEEADKMQAALVTAKKEEINTNKNTILYVLEQEIVARYYFEEGRVQVALRRDREVQAALDLFEDEDKYDELLEP